MGDSMSSVVISGDTSGTVTLTVPAVAGTNTITVPASTGTMALTSQIPISGPAFSTYQISNQTISSATFTKVTFDGETFDTNSNFASSRFTPTVAGYYQINSCVAPASSTNYTIIKIYKNGSAFNNGGAGAGLTNSPANIASLVYLNGTTDYVEIYVYLQGTTPQIQSGADFTYFNGVMVRGA
jgi:hypothetical protein